ncbi:ABC transporter permease [Paenibacillus massiliensis]|uniref:ABC transporter permease n=1 Tax=Paenibacillus massiliensis TaxID=225917 RepID=UPI00047154DE|nr:ABC transporter permease subunit [Paenibacillus massiliensis]
MKDGVLRVHGRLLPALMWLTALFILWQSASWMLLHIVQTPLAQSKLPYIHELVAELSRYYPTLFKEGGITLLNATWGFLLGAVGGILLAVVMSMSRWIEQAALPYAVASQMIPVLGLAPILYGIVRDENIARILIAGYITFFPVTLNMLKGLRSVSLTELELMASCAAKPWQVYVKLRVPAALPAMFNGLKIAAPLAVTGAILVELMGARRGIGVIMLRNLYYGPSHAYMFWCTVMTGAALGVASYLFISWLERRVAPWQPDLRRGGA